MGTDRRKRAIADYGPRTSTLLANQQARYERLLSEANNKLFAVNGELWRTRRALKAALRQLELSHEVTTVHEGNQQWLDE